jgi:uncharacterized protein YjbI with pentapeptide repeats
MTSDIAIRDLEPEQALATEEFDPELDPITTRSQLEQIRQEQGLYGFHICNIDLCEIDLSGEDLTETRWTNVNLRGAKLVDANLSRSTFRYVCLDNANLSGADLMESNWDVDGKGRRNLLRQTILVGARFHKAALRQAFLLLADLTKAKFYEADLTRAVLNGSNCRDTDFTLASLVFCEAIGACFDGAHFSRSNLSCMNFSDASLIDTEFYRANCRGVDWSNVKRKSSS